MNADCSRGIAAGRAGGRAGGRAVVALACCLSAAGCDWFTTFARQPKIDPWEVATTVTDSARRDSVGARGSPIGSVPTHGGSLPSFVVSYNPLPSVIDSMASLVNPTAPTAASLENGRKYFQINCAVCHGYAGVGDGIMTKYMFPPITLVSDAVKARTDGYIYGMIRNGRVTMPSYNRIEELDRWDIVNYVRGLQGMLGAPVPTEKLGEPGETGAKVPGYTQTAPTRPAPFYKFVPGARAGASGDTTRVPPARPPATPPPGDGAFR